jgi:uncharacterized protein
MRYTVRICAIFLVAAGMAQAGESERPLISDTWPPLQDVRKPDRVLARNGTNQVQAMCYTPDGRSLVTAAGKTIEVWAARTGEQDTGVLQQTLSGHNGNIFAIGFSADGKRLVSIADDNMARQWDIATGDQVGSVNFDRKGPQPTTHQIAIFRPKTTIIVFIAGSEVELRDYETGKQTGNLNLPNESIVAAAFLADEKRIAVALESGKIQVFPIDDPSSKTSLDLKKPARCLAASESKIVTGDTSGEVCVVSIEGDMARLQHRIKAHESAVNAISIRGDQLATAGDDGVANVFDLTTGKLLCKQAGHASPIASVVINGSHGQKMATGGADGSVRYWTMPVPPVPEADLEKIVAALPRRASVAPKQPRKLLVFWRADAILHKSGVPAANKAIELMGKETGAYQAYFTRDYEALSPEVLADFDGIVMNSTAHLAIPDAAKRAYLDFVSNGKGVIGIHAAIDTFRDWPEGAAVIGATFGGHPWGPSGTWAIKLDEPNHPLLSAWQGQNFKMHDEVYELDKPFSRADRRVLMSLDMNDPATANVQPLHRADRDFAISYIKHHGAGRVFFCMFGHIGEPFQRKEVLQYYLDGIQYALGDLEVDDSPRVVQQP